VAAHRLQNTVIEHYLIRFFSFPLPVNSYVHYYHLLCTALKSFKQIQTYTIQTQDKYDQHIPNANLTRYQKGVCFTGIELFNIQPLRIISLKNDIKVFKPALKNHLLAHSFHSIEEFTFIENSQVL
jgi:hypothetical protein